MKPLFHKNPTFQFDSHVTHKYYHMIHVPPEALSTIYSQINASKFDEK